jgi:hypothetical protein
MRGKPSDPLDIPELITIARDTIQGWVSMDGRYFNPFILIKKDDLPLESRIIDLPKLVDTSTIRQDIERTLCHLVSTENPTEFVYIYEGLASIGHLENDPSRLLVTIYYTPEGERTWWAKINLTNGIDL